MARSRQARGGDRHLSCLPKVIEQYNEEQPDSALSYLSTMEYRQKKGLTVPETGQEEPICLIPGYLLSQKINRKEEHLGFTKLGGLPLSQKLSWLPGSNPQAS